MKKKEKAIYVLFIAVFVALVCSNMLSHIIYALSSNSYFSYRVSFADGLLFETGGISRYIAAFISQNQWLLVVSFSLITSFIAYVVTKITAGRDVSISLSLFVLCVLYGDYMDSDFVVKLVSCGLISAGVLSITSIFKRNKRLAILSTPIVFAILYFCVVADETMYVFLAMVVGCGLFSRLIVPLCKQKKAVLYTLLAICFIFGFSKLYKGYNPSLTYAMQMEHSVASENWDRTLRLSNKKYYIDQFSCYCSNMALLKTDQMSKHLFYITQKSGAAGLVLPNDYDKLNDIVYDAMGLPSQALRLTYENYISYGKSYYNLQRLIYYYKKCGKDDLSNKFSLHLPSYTPPEPTGYVTHGLDSTMSSKNDFWLTLETVVNYDKNNKTAYELLMAYYALSGRVAKFAELCGEATNHFSDGMPVYFQEVLLVYEEVMKQSGQQFIEYKIDDEIRAQFADFNTGKSLNKYHNTFWFYSRFISPTKGQIALN